MINNGRRSFSFKHYSCDQTWDRKWSAGFELSNSDVYFIFRHYSSILFGWWTLEDRRVEYIFQDRLSTCNITKVFLKLIVLWFTAWIKIISEMKQIYVLLYILMKQPNKVSWLLIHYFLTRDRHDRNLSWFV